jgi:hypothetical protein
MNAGYGLVLSMARKSKAGQLHRADPQQAQLAQLTVYGTTEDQVAKVAGPQHGSLCCSSVQATENN